jgi:hypothetical protein
MTEVGRILIDRDGMTAVEAHEEQIDMASRVLDGESPEEILYEYGLEPDYIFDII